MEKYSIVGWPDIQELMEIEGFDANATLIEPNGAMGIDDCTYLIDNEWLDSLNEEE